ncbi:ATPase [Aneurinibacillus aneurinilyticus]|uniref:ATPase n=1 Tax=Aneurinibacillus aneurinilyticus TaxID=1391 RepID=UPI00352320AB
MKNNHKGINLKEENKMCVADRVEIVSSSNEELYGKIAEIIDIKTGVGGTDLKIKTEDGLELWIDAEDTVSY